MLLVPSASAAAFAGGPNGSDEQPHQKVQGLTKLGIAPSIENSCSVGELCHSPAYATGQLTYHGGPVMHDAVNYAIYWLPPGYSFDNPTIDPGSVNSSNARYESLIEEYLSNVGSSSFYNILYQYPDSLGPPGRASFGGAWLDTSGFPGGRGPQYNPLVDNDIVNEVGKAMGANGWVSNNGNHEFFVFTPYGVYEEGLDFCAWHSDAFINGTDVVFAYMMDPGNPLPHKTCVPSDSPTPHSDPFADYEVSILSHEQFESVTDPLADGWYFGDTAHEVADQCSWLFGSSGPDGGNLVLGGTRFRVQQEWSNAAGGCYLPPTSASVTVSYDILGGNSGSSPPVVTFMSAGILISQTLLLGQLTVNPDIGTVWTVTGNLSGSTTTERWSTLQKTTGRADSTQEVHFNYYHQYKLSFAYQILGGSGPSFAPPFQYSAFGSARFGTADLGPGQGAWVDAGESYWYPTELLGSSPTERWATPGGNGTVGSAGQISVVYLHQYLLAAEYSLNGINQSGLRVFPRLDSTAFGRPAVLDFENGKGRFWLDSGAGYSVPPILSGPPGERWVLHANGTGIVDRPLNLSLPYDQQYLVGFASAPPEGGSASPSSGWYLAGDEIQATARAVPGWQFDGWSGAYEVINQTAVFGVTQAFNETATFSPGIVLEAGQWVSISYVYNGVAGSVPAGSTASIFVPKGMLMQLAASPSSFIFSFAGWGKDATGMGSPLLVSVDAPMEVSAGSGYNIGVIGVLVLALGAAGLVGWLLRSRAKAPMVWMSW